jgi:Galactose oxidase, central domain
MQGWQSANILNAREGHTATLLHSGRVLVHGGKAIISQQPQQTLRTADLYHPDTNEWTATGSTAIERAFETATLLPNGFVLVVGGDQIETEIYDPSTESWSFTGSLNDARTQHAATPLQDGKVLVVGGQPSGRSAEIYDPATQAWTATGKLNEPRDSQTATLLSDGRVLVVGGFAPFAFSEFNVELYHPHTFAWTRAEGLLSGARYGHTATRLPDGKVLVAGGSPVLGTNLPLTSCEIFDPVTGHWVTTGDLNEPRMFHTATLLWTGNVMVVGGGLGFAQGSTDLRTTEFFNPAEGRWTLGPAMSVPRSGASQTLLRRDLHGPIEIKVLVAGGRSADFNDTLDSAELFTSDAVNV